MKLLGRGTSRKSLQMDNKCNETGVSANISLFLIFLSMIVFFRTIVWAVEAPNDRIGCVSRDMCCVTADDTPLSACKYDTIGWRLM